MRGDPFCCLRTPTSQEGIPVSCRIQMDKERFVEKMGKPKPAEEGFSCAGRSILEMAWEELDSVVDRLLTESEAEDGRDPGRAEGMAMIMAIFQNPYYPNIEAIREESVRRWETKPEYKSEEEGEDADELSEPTSA